MSDESRTAIRGLLQECFFAALNDVDNRLCGHEDTTEGFFQGAKAALSWVSHGAAALGDRKAAELELETFVEEFLEGYRESPPETPEAPQ